MIRESGFGCKRGLLTEGAEDEHRELREEKMRTLKCAHSALLRTGGFENPKNGATQEHSQEWLCHRTHLDVGQPAAAAEVEEEEAECD